MEFAAVACIAPAFSDERLAAYRQLIDAVEPKSRLRDALEKLWTCAVAWWEVRESNLPAVDAITGTDLTRGPKVKLQRLDSEVIQSLWDHVPWMEEIVVCEAEFEKLSPTGAEKPLRDAAFHLSWLAKELHNDREPITVDRMVSVAE